MTILSTHAARRVRNRSMGVLHLIAADESCEVSDILALLVPERGERFDPTRAESPKPTEITTPGPSNSGPEEVLDRDLITTPSPEPQPISTPAEQVHDEPANLQAASSRPTSPPGAESTVDPAVDTGKSGEAAASPAPVKKISQRQRIRDLNTEHPEWTARQIANELGIKVRTVFTESSVLKLTLGKEQVGRKRKEPTQDFDQGLDQRLRDLHSENPGLTRPELAKRLGVGVPKINYSVRRLGIDVPHVRPVVDEPFVPEVIPPANPQKPVGAPTAAGKTLTERIRILHQQHPSWTASLIANELGAKANSVSTILGLIRGAEGTPGEAPEFTGKADLVQHYGDVANRLGK